MKLARLLGRDYSWDGNSPAGVDAVAELIAWSPAPLPAEYLDLLRLADGGHATRTEYPTYVRMWPARTVIEYNRDYEIQKRVPGLVGFGDDGGSCVLAFDTRSKTPYSVVIVPFAPMEFESVERVAENFTQFIHRLAPRESRP
jgi:hypothetical protein